MEKSSFEGMLDGLSRSAPAPPEGEYLGKDGLLHCSTCHKATQYRAEIPALGISRVVRCICQCGRDRLDEEERQARWVERERMRRTCFAGSKDAENTFEVDDRKNPQLSDAMLNYVEHFPEMKRQGKGLLLYGTVGTGKTFYAACIANRLIDNGTPCLMTNFPTLVNQLQSTFDGKQEIIDHMRRYPLLIIDDLGVERQNTYMQEQVYNIVNERCRSGLPMIVTTNLTAEEIKKPQDVEHHRIYDRILKHCHPIEVSGASRRRMKVKETYGPTKELLGL